MTFIVNSNELPRDNAQRVSTGEILGSLVNLSQTTGLKDLSIHHEILPPGHRSSPPHKHTQKEELVYVIGGTPTVWIEGEVRDLRPGDAVGFPTDVAHMVLNRSTTPAELIVVSTLLHTKDTCIFIAEDPSPTLLEKREEPPGLVERVVNP
jgi:uncharacterized cupin superfamily protein